MQKKNKTPLELWLPDGKEPITEPYFGLDRAGTPKRFQHVPTKFELFIKKIKQFFGK